MKIFFKVNTELIKNSRICNKKSSKTVKKLHNKEPQKFSCIQHDNYNLKNKTCVEEESFESKSSTTYNLLCSFDPHFDPFV